MNYQYFGLFLNEHNRNELMKIIFANPIITNLVLQRGSTLYLDHCTLLHKNQNDKEIYDSLVKKIDESWMVKSIPLELHHVDFNHFNNNNNKED